MVLFLCAWVLFSNVDSVLGKHSGMKGLNLSTFNFGKAFAAILFPIVLCVIGGFTWHLPTLLFALGYGLLLSVSNYSGLGALKSGNIGIVSTLGSFAMVIPCVYGLVFLKESISVCGIIGLVLIVVSIITLNLKSGNGKGKMTKKFWFYMILLLLSGGFCSLLQKAHQVAYPGFYQSEFLLYSSLIVLFVFAVINVVGSKKSGNGIGVSVIKDKAMIFGLIAGVCNCVANYFIMLLAAMENATTLYPVQSVLSVMSSCLVGYVIFKEKLTIKQWVSVVLGVTAAVLMNF